MAAYKNFTVKNAKGIIKNLQLENDQTSDKKLIQINNNIIDFYNKKINKIKKEAFNQF